MFDEELVRRFPNESLGNLQVRKEKYYSSWLQEYVSFFYLYTTSLTVK